MHTSWSLTVFRSLLLLEGGCTCLVQGSVPAWSSEGCTCLVPGVYLPGPGGVPAWSGGYTCLVWGGCTCLVLGECSCLVPGGCTWSGGWGGGVPAGPRGVPGPGGCTWSGGCTCLVLGVPGQVLPPVDRILDTCFWNYYLGQNFVLAGNKLSQIWTNCPLFILVV